MQNDCTESDEMWFATIAHYNNSTLSSQEFGGEINALKSTTFIQLSGQFED
jgi:hypothetical protein